MKKNLWIISIFLILSFITSCASIKGSDPITRANSAADYLLKGKDSGKYVEWYNTEYAQASTYIESQIKRTLQDPMVYVEIADEVSEWIAFYNKVKTLQKMYPAGIVTKSASVQFVYIDYTNLQLIASEKACDAYFAQAKDIIASGKNPTDKIGAVSLLEKAKTYSSKLDKEINPLGADIAYEAAEVLATSEAINQMNEAKDLFAAANRFIPSYLDSNDQIRVLNKRISDWYIADGNALLTQQNWNAFRQAKKQYILANETLPGSATKELANVNDLLTVSLAIVHKESKGTYKDSKNVTNAINNLIAKNTSGPDAVAVSYIHISSQFALLATDFSDYDLILLPGDNYGAIREIFGPVETRTENVSTTVNGTIFQGIITKQTQEVTVYYQNNYTLFDNRSRIRIPLSTFEWKNNKTSKVFTQQIYEGDQQAKPANFTKGELYRSGSATTSFSGFSEGSYPYAIITQSGGTLNSYGKEICNIITNLSYK